MVEITHRAEFSAAHRLHTAALSDEENRRIYGPCNTVHGHNYAVEVTVRGPVDARTGMVMNLTDLMRVMHEEIISQVDHKHVNEDVPFLAGVIPTAENMAVAFWGRLAVHVDAFAGSELHCVRVVEGSANSVAYHGPSAR
ncbi:MAG: 6-carboxytetrahydropterin synthase [bacterium]|nr:6-carboxytetrahydropterin synthase [bacterium]